MGKNRRKRKPPFESEISGLDARGLGIGEAPDGKPVHVRFAVPGSRVFVIPQGYKKKRYSGRLSHVVRPSSEAVTPKCSSFGLCGGCTLQGLSLAAQRAAKHARAIEEVSAPLGREIRSVHAMRGRDEAFGYRNKVELSFGIRRYVSEADQKAGAPHGGRFLGFHAPGRFDRVVEVPRCELVSDLMAATIDAVREVALQEEAPMPWDVRTHTGFWRHLIVRSSKVTGDCLAVIVTSGEEGEDWVERAAKAALDAGASGILWWVHEGVADVARGEERGRWGSPVLREKLGDIEFELAADAFFQTNTSAAELLYDTVGEALGTGHDRLLDLYCGVGSIGLYLADHAGQILGIEEVPSAIEHAKKHAAKQGVEASFHLGKVEHLLDQLTGGAGTAIVVDPPRAGLHPKVANKLATTDADILIYVACKPGSLGRDADLLEQGHWRLDELWTVDLFPHTGHTEAVGKFVRTDR